MRRPSRLDQLLGNAGRFLHGLTEVAGTTSADRLVAGQPPAGVDTRASGPDHDTTQARSDGLTAEEARHAAGLMRVNHVGEVCAQALYQGQAATARKDELRQYLLGAAAEERRHLDWTRERIEELGGRPSRLVPFWYLSSYALGAAAGMGGDSRSLGFMAETERQVEAHLLGHLETLPAADQRSRDIVASMKADEAGHAQSALARGGRLPPWPVRTLMRAMAKVMTTTAYRI